MTQAWTITDQDGVVLYPSFLTNGLDEHPADNGWEALDGHVFTPLLSEPDTVSEVWDGQKWTPDLTIARERKWAEIKAKRDEVRYGGCMTPKGKIDSDPESQRKIGGAVSMAMMLGDQFQIEWTMFDNSAVTFNAAEMQAAGIALGMFEGQCHAIGRVLRGQIEAATTIEEIEGVSWPS